MNTWFLLVMNSIALVLSILVTYAIVKNIAVLQDEEEELHQIRGRRPENFKPSHHFYNDVNFYVGVLCIIFSTSLIVSSISDLMN